MKTFFATYLSEVAKKVFLAIGTPEEEAETLSAELVLSNLLGIDSHGVVRIPQYVEEVKSGRVKPGAPIELAHENPTTAIVDCGWNFGIVAASRMTKLAYQKATTEGISCVVSRRCHHAGRIGAYVQNLANQGIFGLASANSSRHGHFVSPWGGMEGRLSTNPIAFGAPTSGDPVVMDMSTSTISEGKIRVTMMEGRSLPKGFILDSHGNPTTDPKDFYGPPRGTILPIGNSLGYKGFGLSLLVEVLGSAFAGVPVTPDGETDDYINGVCVIGIDPDAFSGKTAFLKVMDRLVEYVTSSQPAPTSQEVVMPGTYDFRTKEIREKKGIPVDEAIWSKIVDTAEHLGVPL